MCVCRERKHSMKAAGSIKMMTDPNSKFFLFSPTDSKVLALVCTGLDIIRFV